MPILFCGKESNERRALKKLSSLMFLLELFWDFLGAVQLIDIEAVVTFSDEEVVIDPGDVLLGDGTVSSNLQIRVSLDGADFYLPAGDTDGIKATDFHVSITVEHIPEPSSIVLAAIGFPCLASCRPRRRFSEIR